MPWMANLVAALALTVLCVANGNRFAVYDELQPDPVLVRNIPKGCSRYLGLRDCKDRAAPAESTDDADADITQDTSKILNALFGLPSTSATAAHATEAALTPYQLPPMYYNDFYEDLLTSKRSDVHSAGCDCKVMNDLIDLGSTYFPRYLMSAICESRPTLDAKCTHGSNCKPLEYKVKVLTLTPDQTAPKDGSAAASSSLVWLSEEVVQRREWQFKTVTVTAGCFCTS